MALVKVSFGERGSAFGIFQKITRKCLEVPVENKNARLEMQEAKLHLGDPKLPNNHLRLELDELFRYLPWG